MNTVFPFHWKYGIILWKDGNRQVERIKSIFNK